VRDECRRCLGLTGIDEIPQPREYADKMLWRRSAAVGRLGTVMSDFGGKGSRSLTCIRSATPARGTRRDCSGRRIEMVCALGRFSAPTWSSLILLVK
jgi:hypothetical protein